MSHVARDGDRILTLDVMRGIAILGILYLNILFMGGDWPAFASSGSNPDVLGTGVADQWAYRAVFALLDGTQRGLLELLFGASAILLTLRATSRDGPVEVADIYYRRALWLAGFGVVHGTLLLWPNEIWTYYGLTALFIFPFRRLSPRLLALIGASGLALVMAIATPAVLDKLRLQDRVEEIRARPSGAVQSKADQSDMKRWNALLEERKSLVKSFPDAKKAMAGGYVENLAYAAGFWQFNLGILISPGAGEAFFTMLIGMALFKWGVLQGDRSTRFYLALALLGYGIGVSVKWAVLDYRLAHQFGPVGINQALYDYGRLATTLGHVGLICLALRTGRGRSMLEIFKAPGRMPMTVYLGQTLICCWFLFPGFGLGLWGRFGWADLMLIATAVNVLLFVFSHIWMRHYRMGPLEWLWRWLSYRDRQPFRRPAFA